VTVSEDQFIRAFCKAKPLDRRNVKTWGIIQSTVFATSLHNLARLKKEGSMIQVHYASTPLKEHSAFTNVYGYSLPY
jgi:hypothetical protein